MISMLCSQYKKLTLTSDHGGMILHLAHHILFFFCKKDTWQGKATVNGNEFACHFNKSQDAMAILRLASTNGYSFST